MEKSIGIGIEDFKKVINENCYYIDKTKWIEEIIKDKSEIKLFTRPRRFGKTLNMSTLKYFFDIHNKDENRKLFSGLDIEKSPYFSEQGQYPVVFISLKGIKNSSWKDALFNIKSLLREIYEEFSFIKNSLSPSEQDEFDKIWFKKDDGEYENALKNLTTYLYKYYKKEVILLIDEYDSPLISAYKYQYYDEASTFFKIFYGEALKTNSYLKMGIMTGIIRVVKAGVFSDLNNLKVYSILDDFYSDFFGFTQNEVEEALKYFGIEYEISQVKTWYDGYKFGNSDIYNPWSILNFLSDRKIRPYWIDTSDNFVIKDVLKNVDTDTMDTLQKLFLGENVKVSINGYSDLSSLLEQSDLWEFLLFSGYLTINEKVGEDYVDIYSLRIPNKEVREFFKKKFIDAKFSESLFRKTMEALVNLKFNSFEKYLQDILLKSTSYNDTKNEDFYHGLVLGMMFYLDNQYYVKSNEESGLGRYDVIAEPKNKKNRGFILEFKIIDNEKDLEKTSQKAIEQIIEKKYDTALKDRDIKDITFVGIAFFRKLVKICYKN